MTTKTIWTASEVEQAMANTGPAPREDAQVAVVQFENGGITYCYWLLPDTLVANTHTLYVQSPYSGLTRVEIMAIKPASSAEFRTLKLAVTGDQLSRMKKAKFAGVPNITPAHKTSKLDTAAPPQFSVDLYTQFAKHFAASLKPIPLANTLNTIIDRIEPAKEHTTMNVDITNVTFINGTDVKNYTDSQLMGMMQQLDKDIAQLKTMEPLPKRFAKRLEKLEASKKALFELLDSLE